MQFFQSHICMLALYSTAVHATAWVVGYQSSRYPCWNVRQYTQIYMGNPTMVAYLLGSGSSTPVGEICNGSWQEWYALDDPNPGSFDFNCIPPVADVNSNARNNGYKIGGLNHNGVTIAICYIQNDGDQLCDTRTISNASDMACSVSVVCQN